MRLPQWHDIIISIQGSCKVNEERQMVLTQVKASPCGTLSSAVQLLRSPIRTVLIRADLKGIVL